MVQLQLKLVAQPVLRKSVLEALPDPMRPPPNWTVPPYVKEPWMVAGFEPTGEDARFGTEVPVPSNL